LNDGEPVNRSHLAKLLGSKPASRANWGTVSLAFLRSSISLMMIQYRGLVANLELGSKPRIPITAPFLDPRAIPAA
jgi:hypothetical protein